MLSLRPALSAIAASAFTALSLCVAPAASATTGLQTTGFACYVSVVNDEDANFYCDFSWTGGTGPYTVTGRSYDYAAVDWIVVNGESATLYGWCKVGHYLSVNASVTDSTGAVAYDGRGGYCEDTSYGY